MKMQHLEGYLQDTKHIYPLKKLLLSCDTLKYCYKKYVIEVAMKLEDNIRNRIATKDKNQQLLFEDMAAKYSDYLLNAFQINSYNKVSQRSPTQIIIIEHSTESRSRKCRETTDKLNDELSWHCTPLLKKK